MNGDCKLIMFQPVFNTDRQSWHQIIDCLHVHEYTLILCFYAKQNVQIVKLNIFKATIIDIAILQAVFSYK